MRKTWQEKTFDKEGYPKVLTLNSNFPCFKALQKMGVQEGEEIVLVNPSQVIEVMKAVPKGKLITIQEICMKIAKDFRVKGCCSLTAGIFITIAANAMDEAIKENKNLDIPYWRTLKTDGFLNEKFPGGLEGHKALLEKEGHKVISRGTKYSVQDFEKFLIEL
ncbi:MGMT family protein [Candidatus Thorarchaeota archaeon]|nr:MAG: MGMT family protein [Candidatus Thorarchaeota archaeon]